MIRLIEDKRTEIEAICRRYRVRRLEVFGSAATGDFDPQRSDLDFLVEFEELSEGQWSDCYFSVLFALEDLFGRPVDLVMPSAIRNRFFREAVDESREVVYAA